MTEPCQVCMELCRAGFDPLPPCSICDPVVETTVETDPEPGPAMSAKCSCAEGDSNPHSVTH
jgi:hypothetical protein